MSFTEYRAAGGPNSRINQKKELKRLQKLLEKAEKGGALPESARNYNKWLRDNTGIKLLPNGKRQTVWKTGESAGKPFNEKIGKDQWKQTYYGTLTPYQDLKYLRQLDQNEVRLDRLRRNKLRIGASEKDWQGTPIHLLKVDQLEERLNQKAERLRSESSYADFEVPIPNQNKNNKEDAQLPIDKEEAFIEAGAHEWGDAGQPSATIQNQLAAYDRSPDAINTSLGSSSAGTNATSTRDRLKVAQEGIEANPTRIQRGLIEDSGFTAERLAGLKIKQEDFKSMGKQEFAANYPKSQTAKQLKKKRK